MNALLLLALLSAPPEGPVPLELHGRWRVTAEVADGTPTPEERYRTLVIELDARTARLRDGASVLECRAGVSANLRVLALTPKTGPKADRPLIGLYFVSDDLLRICLPLSPDNEAPTDLSARAGSGRVLLSLKRDR